MIVARCPACLTVFRMRPDQLRKQAGMVRCGHCYSPFNALEHLVEPPPPTHTPAPPAAPSAITAPPSGLQASAANRLFILEERAARSGAQARQETTQDQGGEAPRQGGEAPRLPTGDEDELEEVSLDFEIPDSFLAARPPPDDNEPAGIARHTRTSIPYPRLSEGARDHAAERAALRGIEEGGPHAAEAHAGGEAPTPAETRSADTFAARLEALTERRRAEERRQQEEQAPSPKTATEPPASAPDPAPRPEREPAGAPASERDEDSGWPAEREWTPEPEWVGARYRQSEPSSARRWLWGLGVGILLGALAVQAAYLFRGDITRQWPELRPVYLKACEHFGCTVALPRVAFAIQIENSDLQSAPDASGQFTLHARIRNSADYPQQYPHLELTLTDRADRPVARRVVPPKEWVNGERELEDGFPAGDVVDLRLPFEAPQVQNAVGYRIYAFYP